MGDDARLRGPVGTLPVEETELKRRHQSLREIGA
jgi:hypothetical protein